MTASSSSIPFSYYRGGTSKALFFHERDVPPPGPVRDALLKRLMGSPDPMQIDGMGGTHIVTSKIAIIRPSAQPGIDVDYTFAQVSINYDSIGYNGNCGNISAAVGPFAINEGLVRNVRAGVDINGSTKTQEITIYVTGTKKIMTQHVPVDAKGVVLQSGEFAIDGCPGTGAPILIDFSETVGGTCGKGLLPTGSAVNRVEINGNMIEYSTCDVGNLVIFARASDFGIAGDEKPANLDADHSLLARVKELRGKAAQQVGLCKDWKLVDEQAGPFPMVALVSRASVEGAHIQSRLFLDNKCHTSMAGTGAVCHAACSRVPGSIPHSMLRTGTGNEQFLSIQHPIGLMQAAVSLKATGGGKIPEFEVLSFVRTARRILKGNLDIPADFYGRLNSSMAS